MSESHDVPHAEADLPPLHVLQFQGIENDKARQDIVDAINKMKGGRIMNWAAQQHVIQSSPFSLFRERAFALFLVNLQMGLPKDCAMKKAIETAKEFDDQVREFFERMPTENKKSKVLSEVASAALRS